MASTGVNEAFESLPNFRQAGGRGLTNKTGQQVKDGLVYRSARTDYVTAKDKSLFLQLGIKSIIDIRGEEVYRKLTSRPLDDLYTPAVITDNKTRDLAEHKDTSVGRRYLFDVFGQELIRHIGNQVNIVITILAVMFLLPIDKIFGTHFFPRLYSRLVIRRQSLYEQYMDFLEYSKPVFCGMLKLLLSHEENLPVLIHCVYGKDRTGLLVALILDCIGVEREAIAMDYASSEDGLVSMRNEMHDDLIIKWGLADHSCKAKADTMLKVLNEIDKRYGSTSQYLESIGFTLEDQESLKSILLH